MRLRDILLWSSRGFLFVLLLPFAAYGYGIALDPFGCHQNRETETYHCHRGKFRGREFQSKVEMPRELQLGNREEEERRDAAESNITDDFKELNQGRGRYAQRDKETFPSVFIVEAADVPLYARPDQSSAVVARVKKGEKLYPLSQIIGSTGVWYMTRTEDGNTGWVRAPGL